MLQLLHLYKNATNFTKHVPNLKSTSGEEDCWCPIKIASTPESSCAIETHFVVAEICLWSKSLSIFDSMSNDGWKLQIFLRQTSIPRY